MEKNELATQIGLKIRQHRKNCSITQKALAEAVDLDEFYFGQVERGEKMMSLPKLIQICKYFGITLDELIEIPGSNQINELEQKVVIEKIVELLSKCSNKQLQLIKNIISLLSSY